jgi:hypothetical protein
MDKPKHSILCSSFNESKFMKCRILEIIAAHLAIFWWCVPSDHTMSIIHQWLFLEMLCFLLVLYYYCNHTNILCSHTCLKKLNEIIQVEINKIADWLNSNKLSINTAKTKFILFRTKNRKPNYTINISINNISIHPTIVYILQMLHSDWLLSRCLFCDRPRFAKKQRKTIWLLQETRVLLRFLKNILDINNSGHRVYTKTITQLGLLV